MSKNENFNFEELKKRLLDVNKFVVNIIDTIPPRVYFDQEVREKLAADKHARMDQKIEALKGSFYKGQTFTEKVKHKRARLDPLHNKSVSQIQQELAAESVKGNDKDFGKNIRKRQRRAAKRSEARLHSKFSVSHDEQGDKVQKPNKESMFLSTSLARAANIEEVRNRLQERIKEMKAQRNASRNSDPVQSKRQKTKVKKLKRQLKKNTGNLLKSPGDTKPVALQLKKPQENLKPKPIYNKDGKVIFSKFDFADSGEVQKKGPGKGNKDFKTLIQIAEREKEKLENLKSKDKEKADAVMEKNAWNRALQKAQGIKVKDDVALLKKSLKKHEKKKGKSAKQWKDRQEHTKELIKKKQEKRSKNIQAKKREKLDKKLTRARKKGRVIP